MASFNKVLLMGNLTRDPELRSTPSGASVCDIGLAVNRRYVSNGQEKDETCFVDVIVWGKQAESSSRYLQKGSQVFIEGRLNYEQWEDSGTGKKRSRLKVVAERVQFMGRSNGEKQEQGQQQQQRYSAEDRPQQSQHLIQQLQQQYQPPQQPQSTDDVPF